MSGFSLHITDSDEVKVVGRSAAIKLGQNGLNNKHNPIHKDMEAFNIVIILRWIDNPCTTCDGQLPLSNCY